MQIYGILAHPTAHSLSPLIHNVAFQELGVDAQYTTFDIKPENLEEFLQRVRTEKIAGLSVSIPHKVEIIKYLDGIEEEAKAIGAVNTVFWKGNQLWGANTDVTGAIEALEEKTELKGKRVVIFGSGGAARAITYGLKQKKAHLTIYARKLKDAQKLACPYQATYGIPLSYQKTNFDIVINTTPIGMYPHINESILEAKDFNPQQIVFDIVYNPLNTKFIQEARKRGCQTITGDRMFLLQAMKQFEIWIGQKAPQANMRKTLLEKLKTN